MALKIISRLRRKPRNGGRKRMTYQSFAEKLNCRNLKPRMADKWRMLASAMGIKSFGTKREDLIKAILSRQKK